MGFHCHSPLFYLYLLRCLAWHLEGRQRLSFVNGSVAVLGYRRSSGPGGSTTWYCTSSLDYCLVRTASSKGCVLLLVLPSWYFNLTGHTPLFTHYLFVPLVGYCLTTYPAWLRHSTFWPAFISPPLRTRGLPGPNPIHVLPSALRSGLYGPCTITLVYACVGGCLQLGIVKALHSVWACSGAGSTDLGIFGFSRCWVFSWVFGRWFVLVASFMYIVL